MVETTEVPLFLPKHNIFSYPLRKRCFQLKAGAFQFVRINEVILGEVEERLFVDNVCNHLKRNFFDKSVKVGAQRWYRPGIWHVCLWDRKCSRTPPDNNPATEKQALISAVNTAFQVVQ